MTEPATPLTYAEAGVDYERIDPAKVLAMKAAAGTAPNLGRWGLSEVAASRGSTAFVWDEGDAYRAFVLECLGTKSLVADAVRPITGRTHYDAIAQDTVAMAVNDIVAVGAEPQVITAYWATGGSDWFDDTERAQDLARGWGEACQAVGATWGGGETPALAGVVAPGCVDLAAACVGIVKPKDHLVLGDALMPGDAIVLIGSSGVHANGLSLARRIAAEAPLGYATLLDDGRAFGEALLTPTHLYGRFVADLWNAGVRVHYLSNLTGHGWRKIMRPNRQLTYRLSKVSEPSALFRFLVQRGGLVASEAYGSLNMGAGYAVYTPPADAQQVVEGAARHGFEAWDAGRVEAGPKQVVIEPVGVTFPGADT